MTTSANLSNMIVLVSTKSVNALSCRWSNTLLSGPYSIVYRPSSHAGENNVILLLLLALWHFSGTQNEAMVATGRRALS